MPTPMGSRNRWVRPAIFVALLGVAGSFGYFHAVVGEEISFSLFYLIPVAGATWFVNRTAGIAMAGVCGIVALGADIAIGREYSQAWIPVYNALVVCAFFILAAYALGNLRAALELEARLAREDTLTHIPNLRAFREECPEALRRLTEEDRAVTFGLVDLSDLNYINDRYGLAAGDLLLRVLAHSLQRLLRPDDRVFRVSTSTFAVLYPGVGPDVAPSFLERIRDRVLSEMKGYDHPFSVAFVAISADRPSEDSDRLLEHASSTLSTLKLKAEAPHPFRIEGAGVAG